MKERNGHIKNLLDRFFEGQTSGKEERELYHFFKQDDIPEEFAQYKQVIKYFESGLAEELGIPAYAGMTGAVEIPLQRKHSSKKKWIVWGSVAASFLIMLFTSLYFLQNRESVDPFEGSYIIRNGVRITDLDLIRPELEATLQKTLLQQLESELDELLLADNSLEIEIIQQIQAHYNRILENIEDEEIRNEVEFILYTNF